MPAFSRRARRLLIDRVGRLAVSAGGLTIIASILGIFVFIGHEALPLFRGATVRVERTGVPSAAAEQAPASPKPPLAIATGAPVTAHAWLLGERSFVTGHADGTIGIWQVVGAAPVRVRELPRRSAGVTLVAASPRDKSFLVQDAGGTLTLFHSTSARTLWTGRSPVPHATSIAFRPRGTKALVSDGTTSATLAIDNPHPEISWSALFGRVWYEGYDRPEFVWQSSAATDDVEPKLSFVPLVAGTLKGTFYSLALAIPLAVLGAMYTSQFMHHRLRGLVKPVVEIMAALPSVVLGFLAGLWLAPRVEQSFPALLVMVFALPAAALASGYAWRALPARLRARIPAGTEVFAAAAFMVLAAWGSILLSGPVERLLFGGRFQGWLLAATGLGYDQRNAVVVGIAMGFAVIPIIFSVAEDAFSNVPRGLVAGSLALGATRWETVTRVVLPTASPGIFSGVMIGFGRAIGETMIVLMATGNTPITDWNPFNGFRTLSANIAVEIAEAPHGGTLYRTLFLAGLLLFTLTFAVNTAADVVRQRLRRRYGNL